MCSWKEWRYNKFLFVTQDNLTHSSKCTFICLVTLLSGRKKILDVNLLCIIKEKWVQMKFFFVMFRYVNKMRWRWRKEVNFLLPYECKKNLKIVHHYCISCCKKMRPNLVKFATTPHSKKKLSCHLVSCRKKERSQ